MTRGRRLIREWRGGIVARLIMRANLTSISDCNDLPRVVERVLRGPVASGAGPECRPRCLIYRSVQQENNDPPA